LFTNLLAGFRQKDSAGSLHQLGHPALRRDDRLAPLFTEDAATRQVSSARPNSPRSEAPMIPAMVAMSV
jgi:hypothetical protein